MTPEQATVAAMMQAAAKGESVLVPLIEQKRLISIAAAHHDFDRLGYTAASAVPLGVRTPPVLGTVLEYGSAHHEKFLKVGLVECLSRDRLRVSSPDFVAGRQGLRATFGPGFIARRVWTRTQDAPA